MLSRLIEQLSGELGWIEPITKENDGSYILLFEPSVKVILKEETFDVVRFFSHLVPLPNDNEAHYLLHMMSANLLGKHIGRNIFGLDSSGKEIVLSHFLIGQISYGQFRNSLEDFINYSETLGAEISAKRDGI